jgi:iron complex transport system substrate-binding protein
LKSEKRIFKKIIYTVFILLIFLSISIKAESGSDLLFSDEGISNNYTGKSDEESPKRIISLAPNVTEILYSFGLENNIAGVTEECNYPPEAGKKTRVSCGGFINYERIIALKPDLIIIESSIRKIEDESFRRFDIPLLKVNSSSYEGYLDSILQIGRVTKRESRARECVDYLNNESNAIENKWKSDKAGSYPKVFVEVWKQPLFTAGRDTYVDYMIRKSGGINIAGDLKGFPAISPEMLLVRDPDIIILTNSKKQSYLSSQIWKNLKAVKNGRVYELDPDLILKPSLQMPKGCQLLYENFFEN